MEIVIDISAITKNPLVFAWWFFKTIGWIIPVFLFILALIYGWQAYIRTKYRQKRKYILIAVDVPKDNEQTPKAVENIFNHLSGAHQPLKFYQKWWDGEIPDSFSFEIISIGGYIQFIIHTEESYRDLIEAMIYAQYPEAEVTEIEDYTKNWKIRFPNSKYQLWGSEIKLARSQYLPIRTYREFEDPNSKVAYKDSMAALLEALTRIGPGEQIWVQFVITPADNDWGDGAEPLINKIIGAKGGEKKSIFDRIFEIFNYLFATTPSSEGQQKQNEPNKILYLTPGEKDMVTAIEDKTAKIGFHTKIRIIYLAEKNKYKSKIPHNIYGAFKQFNTLDLNALKHMNQYLTGGIVWFKERRKNMRRNKILYRYKWRGHWEQPGSYGPILNSEELAGLYHFPNAEVKAPLLKTTEAKKSQPPISLPVEASIEEIKAQEPPNTKVAPPSNLPT